MWVQVIVIVMALCQCEAWELSGRDATLPPPVIPGSVGRWVYSTAQHSKLTHKMIITPMRTHEYTLIHTLITIYIHIHFTQYTNLLLFYTYSDLLIF